MIFIAIVVGCILGAIIGIYAPMVPYTYSGYLAIAIIAALDSVFGGIASTLNKQFDLKYLYLAFWECYFIYVTYLFRTKIKCRYLLSSNRCICRKNV